METGAVQAVLDPLDPFADEPPDAAEAAKAFRPSRLTLAIGVAFALLTLPALGASPGHTLDASWVAALHMAAQRRMHFGSEIVFTYGPLGFLTLPIPYFAATWTLSVAYIVTLRLILCMALVTTLRRSLGLPLSLAAGFLVAAASRDLAAAELALSLFVAGGVRLLTADRNGSQRERLAVAIGGATAGVHLMVKLNTGVFMLAVGATVAWVVGRRGWRSEAVFFTAATTTLTTGWVLTGNRISDLALYLRRSWQVAAGYSEAMGLEQTARRWEYLIAAVVVVLVAGLAYQLSLGLPGRRRMAAAAVVAAWLYIALKHGFVRHDGHSGVFFGEALVVAVLLGRATARRRETLAVAGLVVVALLSVNFAGAFRLGNSRPDPLGTMREAARLLRPGGLPSEVAEARGALRHAYGLDGATLAALAGHTVHLHPWDAGIAWAYPQIDWQPIPVFQAYSAYTSVLDAANAAALAADDGPERILAAWSALDGRYPLWESPEAMRAMACHYVEVGVQGRWQVLARVPDRCGAELPIATVKASPGDTVPVPAREGAMVVARIHGLDASPLYRVRAQLTKIPPVHVVLDGVAEYRVVPGTLGGGLILTAPHAVIGWTSVFAPPTSTATLRIVAGGWGVGQELEIEFTSVPIRALDRQEAPDRRYLAGGRVGGDVHVSGGAVPR